LAVSAGAIHVINALSLLVKKLIDAAERAAAEMRKKAEKAAERLKRGLQRLERHSPQPPRGS